MDANYCMSYKRLVNAPRCPSCVVSHFNLRFWIWRALSATATLKRNDYVSNVALKSSSVVSTTSNTNAYPIRDEPLKWTRVYVRPDCARFSYARLYVALAFVRDDAFEFCRKNFYFVIVNIDFFLFHIIIDSISTLFLLQIYIIK